MATPSTRAILEQHRKDITGLFADRLAARLGRTAAEIRDEGLGAGDFEGNERIELALCDGSTMSFRYAFAVFDDEERIVGVFTEHGGHHCFAMADLALKELRDEKVVSRRSW